VIAVGRSSLLAEDCRHELRAEFGGRGRDETRLDRWCCSGKQGALSLGFNAGADAALVGLPARTRVNEVKVNVTPEMRLSAYSRRLVYRLSFFSLCM